MRMTREFYIPKGAVKVADKQSDAVAYLYSTPAGQPAVRVFYGKQSKPVVAYYYTPRRDQTAEQLRTAAIANAFAMRQGSLGRKAERAAERKARPRALEVGAFYYTSWGYDQTNIDWYQVVELVGKASAKVVKVAPMDASKGNEGWAQGKSVPSETQVGEPFMVRANGDGFKVKGRYSAWRWDGTPKSWTAYA